MKTQNKTAKKPATFSVFCWNIANPSEERAGKQASWLLRRPEDVLVLTEAKQSKGCTLIERYLIAMGYNIIFPKPIPREYGIIIIAKQPMITTGFADLVEYIPSRVASIKVNELEVIGVYVPSRGFDEGSILAKKQHFVKDLSNALTKSSPAKNRIFCGDLNVIEPNHIPCYKHFKDWEYNFYQNLSKKHQLCDAFRRLHPEIQEHSWFGRSGDGYRYDHCFVSDDLVNAIEKCYYLHEPRETKLSDHSAMILELNFERR